MSEKELTNVIIRNLGKFDVIEAYCAAITEKLKRLSAEFPNIVMGANTIRVIVNDIEQTCEAGMCDIDRVQKEEKENVVASAKSV